jgi:hypothetical protein
LPSTVNLVALPLAAVGLALFSVASIAAGKVNACAQIGSKAKGAVIQPVIWRRREDEVRMFITGDSLMVDYQNKKQINGQKCR